jgi:predicted nucleotidyltransferase
LSANLNHGLIRAELARQPFPLVFATISGAHLYGFPSPDSDYDIRGVHVLPVKETVGLKTGPETLDSTAIREGVEMDVVTQELKKFMLLMLKRNGYVLEQLFSPLVAHTTPEHAELIDLGRKCITRFHNHHYLGFADNQWKLFHKEEPRRVKPLLYVFRVLLTGIHLMQTGVVEANLVTLNGDFKLSYVDDLIARKTSGPEQGPVEAESIAFFEAEFHRLMKVLEEEGERSSLREEPEVRKELNDLLVRIKLRTI